jgi:hypothetical protein
MIVPFRLGRSEVVAGECAEGLIVVRRRDERNGAMRWGINASKTQPNVDKKILSTKIRISTSTIGTARVIPIYEQGGGRGIGYGLNSFLERFDAICHEHIANRRAKAFALIFYDFGNSAIKRILKDHGVFASLDRLSGSELSIFYLHSAGKQAANNFNSEMLLKLGLPETTKLPCVVFFKFANGGFTEIAAAELDSSDLIHAFPALSAIIASYLAKEKSPLTSAHVALRWIKGTTKFISLEIMRGIIRSGLGHFL